jgi:dolichol-phosphate mannosyltransferase
MSDMNTSPSGVPEAAVSSPSEALGAATPVTVVVPTFNEAQNLPELVKRICASLPDVCVLVVDDDSRDGTPDVARNLAKTLPVRIVERRGEKGLSTAVLRGLAEASTDLCVVMDADLSHPPESIPRMVKGVLDGADIVVGSRYVRGGDIEDWPLLRRLTSWAGTLLARPLTTVRDPMAGFFCLRRSLIDGASLKPRGFKILLEILARTGTSKTAEIPIRFEDRSKGASKFGPAQRREYLQQIRDLYRDLNPWPLRGVKFLCTGAIGILPNLAVLNLAVRLGASREAGVMAGWVVSMSTNYILNRVWTFRAGSLPVVSSYVKYALGVLGGLGVQVAVMHALPAWNVSLSAVLGIIAGTLFNYLSSQLWAFARK